MKAPMLVAMGDRAVAFTWAASVRVDRVALLATLRSAPGVVDVVLAETSGTVVRREDADADDVDAAIAEAVASCSTSSARDEGHPSSSAMPPRLVTIPVRYDGADLAEVAAALGVSRDEVVSMHTAHELVASMVGFMPGFAYLRGIDPKLVLPRRASPRPRIPARSVAIAAGYAGVYPFAAPGGWHLLGTTSFAPFDDAGARIALGDRVRFVEAPDDAPPDDATSAMPRSSPIRGGALGAPHLEIARIQGAALLVDAGRFGHMHEGVPHGGPLVPRAFARAQSAAGNAAGLAAIELYGSLTVTARGGPVVVATDVDPGVPLRDGESRTFATGANARARYVAAAGGFDVPAVLGSRTTLLTAAIGGYRGRLLARDDALAIGGEPVNAGGAPEDEDIPLDPDAPIPLRLGPDPLAPDTVAGILASSFRVASASNRTGTRLDGPPVVGHDKDATAERPSRPMVRGAIELTPAGLIVLGPDHPTTGGYPVPAVVREHAIGALFARPIGSAVRFVI